MWPRFRNPWWVVFGAVTGLLVCNGPVLAYTFGIFLKPITADMGWQRGETSFALSVGSFVGSMAVPFLGIMMDRWRIRTVALPGIVIYTSLLALVGLSPNSFWAFTLLFGLAEAASSIQTPIAYAKAISAWFDRRRGRALGIAMAGIGIGAFIMPQLSEYLIGRIGWRGAYTVLAGLTLAIAFPAVALFIREPQPGEGEYRRNIGAEGLPGLTIGEAARTGRFWLMIPAFSLVAIAINGTVGHVVPLLTDHGLSPGAAAATMGLYGLATMTGRLTAGFLVDRIFAPYVAAVFFLAPISGFVFLASATGILPAIGVILMGLGLGTEIDLIAFLVTRYFGQRSFGQLYGCFFMVFGMGTALGRYAGGAIYDMAGSYNPGLIGAGISLVIAVALITRIGPYVYPVERDGAAELVPARA
ncbi:MAG TPA: MFS transporter [Stellaceae bacterium]|jgi:predicted MFS family arabinose efflux permease|nr:MFS transporter [Stellaceae bacterium]